MDEGGEKCRQAFRTPRWVAFDALVLGPEPSIHFQWHQTWKESATAGRRLTQTGTEVSTVRPRGVRFSEPQPLGNPPHDSAGKSLTLEHWQRSFTTIHYIQTTSCLDPVILLYSPGDVFSLWTPSWNKRWITTHKVNKEKRMQLRKMRGWRILKLRKAPIKTPTKYM